MYRKPQQACPFFSVDLTTHESQLKLSHTVCDVCKWDIRTQLYLCHRTVTRDVFFFPQVVLVCTCSAQHKFLHYLQQTPLFFLHRYRKLNRKKYKNNIFSCLCLHVFVYLCVFVGLGREQKRKQSWHLSLMQKCIIQYLPQQKQYPLTYNLVLQFVCIYAQEHFDDIYDMRC